MRNEIRNGRGKDSYDDIFYKRKEKNTQFKA